MDNVANLMASRLTPESLSVVRAVGEAAEAASVSPFLVGGSVRDALLEHQANIDIDISLVGADGTTLDRIAEMSGGLIARRSQFGTVKLQLGSFAVDLAMARAEEYPSPGVLPVVRPGTLEEDMSRRDFSVNAMAVSLSSEAWGDLVDMHSGLSDLREGRLRILHRASFRDDPTRILRAARYSSRLALVPTSDTLDALRESVTFLDSVSPARVRNELERVFQERDTCGAMELLSSWGVLAAIQPSLNFREESWRRFGSESVSLSPELRVTLGYAVLSSGLSDSDASGLIARLNPGASARGSIQTAAELGRTDPASLASRSNSDLARVLDPLAESAVLGVSLVTDGELGCRISQYLSSHRDFRPHLTGDALIAMGAPRGPAIGRILECLRNSWLDGEVSSAGEERALAERLADQLAES